MKLRKGDKVIVIAGKDKGKSASIVRVLPKEDLVVLDGVNIVKKHRRRRSSRERGGQIIERAMPIHASNVMIIDPKSGKPTRVRVERKGGIHARVAIKSGSEIK